MRTDLEPREIAAGRPPGPGRTRAIATSRKPFHVGPATRDLKRNHGPIDPQAGARALDVHVGKGSPPSRQVCDCDQLGRDIDAATQVLIGKLNEARAKLGVTPQCEINGTLNGKERPS